MVTKGSIEVTFKPISPNFEIKDPIKLTQGEFYGENQLFIGENPHSGYIITCKTKEPNTVVHVLRRSDYQSLIEPPLRRLISAHLSLC